MKCSDCEIFIKRETRRKDIEGNIIYYPTGICPLNKFNKNKQRMFCSENTRCNDGKRKL